LTDAIGLSAENTCSTFLLCLTGSPAIRTDIGETMQIKHQSRRSEATISILAMEMSLNGVRSHVDVEAGRGN